MYMYAEVDNKQLGKTLFINWRHIVRKEMILTVKNPHGTAVGMISYSVVHFIIEFR